MAVTTYPNNAKKIQVKGSGGIYLFPRVRTADMTVAANDTAIFGSDDKLKIDYVPTTDEVHPKDTTQIVVSSGTANESSVDYDMNALVPTEAAVRNAISAFQAGLTSGVTAVAGANGIGPATAASGDVTVSGINTKGDGTTIGVVKTLNVLSNELNTASAALGLTAPAAGATTSTMTVPTWDALYNVTSLLVSKVDSAQSNAIGKHSHDSSATNGVYLAESAANTGVWVAKASAATTAAMGTVKLATSANIYGTTKGSVVATADLTERYRGAIKITSVYDTTATTTGLVNGDIVLVKSGASVGPKYFNGTTLADASVNTGIFYKADTGVAYVKNVTTGANPVTTYVPLVRGCSTYLGIDASGVIFLSNAASSAIANFAAVSTAANANKITSVGTTNGLAGGGSADSTATTVTVSGINVRNLATITASTTALITSATGVVNTINDITATGITTAQTAAVTTGKIYTATTFSSALSNNIVPTVNAIQNACLFYDVLT